MIRILLGFFIQNKIQYKFIGITRRLLFILHISVCLFYAHRPNTRKKAGEPRKFRSSPAGSITAYLISFSVRDRRIAGKFFENGREIIARCKVERKRNVDDAQVAVFEHLLRPVDLERIDVIERCDAHLLLELRFEARRGQRALERDVVYADIGRQMLINELQRLQNISRHQPVADAAVIHIQVKIRRDGSAWI